MKSTLKILFLSLSLGALCSLVLAQAPKTITISEVFWPSSGFAIETDDARSLSRWGVTETLIKVDFDGQMVPMLASSWEQTSPLEWVFTLREDVTFHNGEAFNVEAVVIAFDHLLASETPPRGLDPESIESVEAISEFQVAVNSHHYACAWLSHFCDDHECDVYWAGFS